MSNIKQRVRALEQNRPEQEGEIIVTIGGRIHGIPALQDLTPEEVTAYIRKKHKGKPYKVIHITAEGSTETWEQ